MKRKFRFSITLKLAIAFGVLLIAVLYNSYRTYNTLEKNRRANETISHIYTPSVAYLHDLEFLITNSKMLIKNWVYIDKKTDTPDKLKLKELHESKYPRLARSLKPLVSQWKTKDSVMYAEITHYIEDSLFQYHRNIMGQLNSFEAYQDPMIIMLVEAQVEERGEVVTLTDSILVRLDNLIQNQESMVENANKKMANSFERFKRLVIIMGIILVLAVILSAFSAIRAIVRPIRYIKRIILSMSRGVLPKDKLQSRSDEIGEMAEALNLLIQGLEKTSEFSLEIGKGNLSSEFQPLSDQDVLGNSLIKMRESLKTAAMEENKRKLEDQQRTWTAQGLAQFSELLRQNTNDLHQFSDEIVKSLVRYLDINQGGLFVINEEDNNEPFIELMSCFAYDRQKIDTKKIAMGEGLVGRAIQENETIYMTDIPTGYINITSGLGEDPPTALLLVPLKINDRSLGVIELADFREFEPYQIDFIEKIAESIASTIRNVRINANTARLLSESREKSERLAQQEEEMRQNIEEMQATQEEMVKKHKQELDELKERYEAQMLRDKQLYKEQEAVMRNDIQSLKMKISGLDMRLDADD